MNKTTMKVKALRTRDKMQEPKKPTSL